MILGIDAGNNEIKILGPYGEMKFSSLIGEYREIMEESLKGDSIVYEYQGKKGFAGSLAKYESDFAGAMSGDSKAHPELKLRILIALHLYASEKSYMIVVGQPVGSHKPGATNYIKELLTGEHTITVNGKEKTFTIEKVEVAPEGTAAYFVKPEDGTVRIIDVGSGTINFATVLNGRPIDKDSFTADIGMNSTKEEVNLQALGRFCITKTSRKWKKKDIVYVVGGVAEYVLPYIEDHYKYAKTIYPVLKKNGETYAIEPIYANAYGFYQLAKKRFS